jgi:hypothetical protein
MAATSCKMLLASCKNCCWKAAKTAANKLQKLLQSSCKILQTSCKMGCKQAAKMGCKLRCKNCCKVCKKDCWKSANLQGCTADKLQKSAS